jgi:hypothetical protein
VTSSATRSLFEQALDLCETSAEREKVQRLAVRLQLNENASEWIVLVLHAEGRGIYGDRGQKALASFAETLDRMEQRLDDLAKRPAAPGMAGMIAQRPDPLPYITAAMFLVALGGLIYNAISAWAYARQVHPTSDALCAAFSLGLLVTACVLTYLWIAGVVYDRKRGR